MSDPAAPRSLRALVVDDHGDAAHSLALLLRVMGHDARVAGGGAEALAVVSDWTPDVAVLDLLMQPMDGFELAKRLCATLPRRPLLITVTCLGAPQDIA